jgi:hypothetical protein
METIKKKKENKSIEKLKIHGVNIPSNSVYKK